MLKKLKTTASNSFRYLKREGIGKFTSRLLKEIPYRLRRGRSWCRNQLVGHVVELCGNSWKLDGLRFSFDTPAISRTIKSRFVWGTYEDRERKLIARHVRPDLPVIEGGGSIGVISCLTNRLLKRPADHIVIEANPELIGILTKNRDLNGCKFDITCAALDQHGPTVTFYLHKLSVGGSAQRATGKPVTVPAVTVKGLLEKHHWQKISLVLDIEGAEIDLVNMESETLKHHVAILIIEMHPMISKQEEIDAALKKIEGLGFTLKDRALDVYAYYNERLLSSL